MCILTRQNFYAKFCMYDSKRAAYQVHVRLHKQMYLFANAHVRCQYA